MEKLIIYKDTPGIVDKGFYFEYTGNLISNGPLEIKIKLVVTGDIISNGDIISEGDIRSEGDIISECGIRHNGDIKGTIKKIFGIETSFCVILALRWKTYVFDNYLKIGCKTHTIKEWENFSDSEISEMDDDALEFWRIHKQILIGIHESMAKKGEIK